MFRFLRGPIGIPMGFQCGSGAIPLGYSDSGARVVLVMFCTGSGLASVSDRARFFKSAPCGRLLPATCAMHASRCWPRENSRFAGEPPKTLMHITTHWFSHLPRAVVKYLHCVDSGRKHTAAEKQKATSCARVRRVKTHRR